MQKLYRQAMKCFKPLIISSVSILLLLVTASYACDVVLKQSSEVSSDSVYLKDITTKCPNNIKNLFIADSPYINNPLTVTKEYISAILKRNHFDVSVCGKSVKIMRKKYLITKRDILSLLKMKDMEIISKMPVVLPYNHYTIKVGYIKNNGMFVYIGLSVLKNGRLYRNIGISAKRKVVSVFPVAKVDIRRGEIIRRNEITFKKIPVLLQSISFRSLKAIVGKVAITDIRQGQPFTSSNTKIDKLVKRGDLIRVDVVYGSIRITTIAKALRGGVKSDIIPIMYLKSKRMALATIVGEKEVEVQ